jgi:hypothetical protein
MKPELRLNPNFVNAQYLAFLLVSFIRSNEKSSMTFVPGVDRNAASNAAAGRGVIALQGAKHSRGNVDQIGVVGHCDIIIF